MTSKSKNSVRTYETDIEKSREESNWKKAVELAQQLKARSPQHESLAHFLIGEGKLEVYLDEWPPIKDNTERAQRELSEPKGYLTLATDEAGKKAGVALDAHLLLGKLHFACGSYDDALKHYKFAELNTLTEKELPVRSLRIVAESYAIKGLCLEQSVLPSSTSKFKQAEWEAEMIRSFELASELTLLYLQRASAARAGATLETALQRAPLLHIRAGRLTAAIDRYREMLTAVESGATQALRLTLARQLAEVLMRGVTGQVYKAPQGTSPPTGGTLSRRREEQASDGPWKPKKYAAINQFVPRNVHEEVVLSLVVGEAMAVRDAVLSQSAEFEAARAHSLYNAMALVDLLAVAVTRWGQLPLLLESLERAMKFSFGCGHIWRQRALATAAASGQEPGPALLARPPPKQGSPSWNAHVRAVSVARRAAPLVPHDAPLRLVAATTAFRAGWIEEGIELAEQALSAARARPDTPAPRLARCYLHCAIGHQMKAQKTNSRLEKDAENEVCLKYLVQSVRLDDNDHLAFYHLALQYVHQGMLNEAMDATRACLSCRAECGGGLRLAASLWSCAAAGPRGSRALHAARLARHHYPAAEWPLWTLAALQLLWEGGEAALATGKELLRLLNSAEEADGEQQYAELDALSDSLRDDRHSVRDAGKVSFDSCKVTPDRKCNAEEYLRFCRVGKPRRHPMLMRSSLPDPDSVGASGVGGRVSRGAGVVRERVHAVATSAFASLGPSRPRLVAAGRSLSEVGSDECGGGMRLGGRRSYAFQPPRVVHARARAQRVRRVGGSAPVLPERPRHSSHARGHHAAARWGLLLPRVVAPRRADAARGGSAGAGAGGHVAQTGARAGRPGRAGRGRRRRRRRPGFAPAHAAVPRPLTRENVKMCKPRDVELDKILRDIGQFGRYQCHVYRWVVPVIIFNAMYKSQYIFNAAKIQYSLSTREDFLTDLYRKKSIRLATRWPNAPRAWCVHALADRSTMSEKKLNLDTVLEELGQFGRYQIKNYLLILVPILLSAIYNSQYIFAAASINYRCRVPQCEETPPRFETNGWGPWALPDSGGRCERYVSTGDTCSADAFNNSQTERCKSWVYEHNNTIVATFDLACAEWKRTLVGTIHSAGIFIALPLTAYISDTFGRRVAFILTAVAPAVVGVIRSFSTNYSMYVSLELIEAIVGSGVYTSGFILALEMVGINRRVLGGNMISCAFAIGQALVSLIAWGIPEWRTLTRVLYAPSFIFILYCFMIEESVRWLLSKGKIKEAARIIFKAAEINKKKLSPETIKLLTDENVQLEGSVPTSDDKKESLAMQVLRSRVLMSRLFICSFWWITVTFIYYGLSINSVSLGGNSYVNYLLTALVEIPGYCLSVLTLDRFGRKASIMTAFFVCGLSLLGLPFIPEHVQWAQTCLNLLGKMAISMVFSSIYIYTSELYPTSVRHTMVALCSMGGRIGQLIAPQTPLLMEYMPSLPYLLFGLMAAIAGFLMLLTPETLHIQLPDTIKQAEGIAIAPRTRKTTDIIVD